MTPAEHFEKAAALVTAADALAEREWETEEAAADASAEVAALLRRAEVHAAVATAGGIILRAEEDGYFK